MDFLKPPAFLDNVPYGGPLFYGALGVIALLVLFVLLRLLTGGKRKRPSYTGHNLEEDLGTYPNLRPSTGDRRLLVEGVPVRLRLVVLAPAGHQSEVEEDAVGEFLDHVLAGLGQIYDQDRPRVRVWPTQLSYEGFANVFEGNIRVPGKEGEPSPWVTVAGLVRLGKRRVMLGLALQAVKPNSIGRRRLEPDAWGTVMRVRVRE